MSRKKPRGLVRLLVTVLALGSFMHLAPESSKAATFQLPNQCRSDRMVHDFLSPLSGNSVGKGFSRSGRLRGGPSALRVYPPRDRLELTSGVRFAIVGAVATKTRSQARLDWVVTSRLARVFKRSERHIWSKEQVIPNVRSFAGRDFGVRGLLEPGIYRLDVFFKTGSGQVMDHRSELLRVVKPASNLALEVQPMSILPGGTAYLRVLNFGTVDATFSYFYSLRDVNGRSVFTEPQIVDQGRPRVAPGEAGKCFKVVVPAGIATGSYEVGVNVVDALLHRPVRLWSEFVVVGGP